MTSLEESLAKSWACLRCEQPQLVRYVPGLHGNEQRLRHALRQAGVPVLEMNQAPGDIQALWLNEARYVSEEFLSPVVVLGRLVDNEPAIEQPIGQMQVDAAWLSARQVALTSGVENSCLHREFRRTSEKSGWIRIGWHEEGVLAEGNGLLLAWSSPLPLMRIRNFSARCPSQLKIEGPDPNRLAEEVHCHGISVTHWQIEVK